jgi:hypothetical protein
MKPLVAFFLFCAPVFAADSGIKVDTATNKDAETERISTKDVFRRDGQTILMRDTTTKAGILQCRIHRFYHAGSLVGSFTAVPHSAGFVTEPESPYSISLEFDAHSNVLSAVIGTKDGLILDIFTCSKGVFSPVENSVLQKANALGANIKQLFDPEHIRKTSAERFGQQVHELVKEHNKK